MIDWMGRSSPMIAMGWLIAFNNAALVPILIAVSLVKVAEGVNKADISNIIDDIDRK